MLCTKLTKNALLVGPHAPLLPTNKWHSAVSKESEVSTAPESPKSDAQKLCPAKLGFESERSLPVASNVLG